MKDFLGAAAIWAGVILYGLLVIAGAVLPIALIIVAIVFLVRHM